MIMPIVMGCDCPKSLVVDYSVPIDCEVGGSENSKRLWLKPHCTSKKRVMHGEKDSSVGCFDDVSVSNSFDSMQVSTFVSKQTTSSRTLGCCRSF